MSLEAKVMEELKAAMRAKDEVALRTLRAIKAAILVEQTASGAKESLSEADELKLLTKMSKQRKDSLEIFTQQNRTDLAQKEQEEIEIINKFLPAQLSNEELEAEVKAIIAEVGATSAADLGKVMGSASKKLAGRADGKLISETVKRLLA
ncbi:GatB/YqeY domain-containing protein [Edaphocola flava]|uniref:GatB/YqeY domain-containing protein n=1 Tax=Edaphocola flava TaxID=2499629 RepID=UPI00100B22A2|nr:GatB/YqeY domain-containing protein [Edaphocola flava]